MYAYMDLVQDSAECLLDKRLFNIDVRDRGMADEEEGGVN